MKRIFVVLFSFIIILINTSCAAKVNTDTSSLSNESAIKAEDSISENIDIEEMSLIINDIDALCSKITESKKSGSSDWILTSNKISEIKKVVYPELHNDGFYLLFIEVNPYNIFYYYMPKSSMEDTSVMFDYHEGIVVTVSRAGSEEINAFDAVKKQSGWELTKDGYLYDEKKNDLCIPYDFSWISIRVPDELNTYETLTGLYTFKEIVPQETSNDTTESQTSPVEEPPVNEPTTYASIDELKNAININFSEVKLAEIEEQEAESSKGTFRTFIEKRKTENELLVPVYNDGYIVLRNKEGYSNITLFASELFNRPWIWYHCSINGCDFTIKIMYIDDEVLKKSINNTNASWLVKQIDPNAPNVDNYTSFSNYKQIYTKEYDIKERKIQAMVSELKDDPRISIEFIYDDILVSIQAEPNIITEDFMSKLAFKEVPLA